MRQCNRQSKMTERQRFSYIAPISFISIEEIRVPGQHYEASKY
jgi:hypothetical protein